jgi:hypothetical protein
MGNNNLEIRIVRTQPIISRKLLLWIGIISIFAAVGCVAADLILQYDPQGNYSLTTPAPLTIALWRVFVGSFLGVFCISLEITGYWVVCTLLAKTSPRLFRVLFWMISYGIVIGTVFHGSVLALILIEQAGHNAIGVTQATLLHLQNMLIVFILPLGVFFEICYFILWGIVVVTILRNKTYYPKWFVLFVPVLGSLVITGIGQSHIIPVLGNILYPTVLSLPHLCFFTVSTLYFRKIWVTKIR